MRLSLKKIEKLDRATSLFNTSRKYLDSTLFQKTAHLNSAQEFIDNKLCYHNDCLRKHEKNECKKLKTDDNSKDNRNSILEDTIEDVIRSFELDLKSGNILSISDVSELVASKLDSGVSIKNAKVKSSLIEYYGDTITFISPSQKNVSQLFYYNDAIPAIVEKSYLHDCVKNSASILKKSLNDVDFEIDDKYCDEHNLRDSLEDFIFPKPFINFLSIFCNVKKKNLESKVAYVDEQVEDSTLRQKLKLLRVRALFQNMFFIGHNGFKKTPLHTLLGLQVWSKTKSKSLITMLNRLGYSISYDEARRIRTELADYAKESSNNDVILPSHFDPNIFVTAAFDNLDFKDYGISGKNSVHETKIVAFQDYDPNNKRRKPPVPCTPKSRAKAFKSHLNCQELQKYELETKVVKIPTDYEFPDGMKKIVSEDYQNVSQKLDFAWLISKMNITSEGDVDINNEY